MYIRKIFCNFIALSLSCFSIAFVSCRDESDEFLSYAYNDELIFAEAKASLAGQFKAIWSAMNSNYAIWDYEEEHGIDWDDVYDKYLPKFEELDQRYSIVDTVPDSIVMSLYREIFEPLHDGHLEVNLTNVHTGKKIGSINPNKLRQNGDLDLSDFVGLLFFEPSLNYYRMRNKEIEDYEEADGYMYGRFKDDIVYFHLPKFNLEEVFAEKNSDNSKEKIGNVWSAWFNEIQRLQTQNTLKGVIIDLRNNPGGSLGSYKYVLGALQDGKEIGGDKYFQVGYTRFKSGVGRLDYSPLYAFSYPILKKPHEIVSSPIVILANKYTGSLSEISCIAAKQMSNGCVIGTKTYGAFSPLVTNSFSHSYSGIVGDPALSSSDEQDSYFAPFYIYMPSAAFLSLDKKIIDSGGVDPDILVPMDWDEFHKTRKDAQLDRALEYIRTGE